MLLTNSAVDGSVIVQWWPRYDSSTLSVLRIRRPPKTTQCPGNAGPQSVAGVPGYPATVGVCVTRTSYDYAGNRANVVLGTSSGTDNRYITYNYTDDNLVASITAPSPAQAGARVTSLSSLYDGDRQLVKSTDALGIQGIRSYTSDGRLSQITNPPNGTLTHIQTFTYDANGNQVTGMSVAGQKWTYTYYADNLRKTPAHPSGDTDQDTYDQARNATQAYSPPTTPPQPTHPSAPPSPT